MINLSITPSDLQILNSALSTYYSTRADVNPIKLKVKDLKDRMLILTTEQGITPSYIEY
jgi:hypothetical protein